MNNFADWMLGHHEITLSTKQRSTHTYVIGQSGTGKSRALESWIMQDILAGHGVGVIDPHGELYNHLLARIAVHPEIWEKVILLNPVDPDWVLSFNPLETIDQISAERLAMHMTDVSTKVWNLDSTKAPRMVWLLTNTFLALVSLNLTMLDLPQFLIDREFRESLISKVKIPSVRQYFESEFPTSEKSAHQWIAPVLNKIGGLMFDLDIRLIFNGENSIDFRAIIDNKMILLVNLSKGTIGEGMSALLASFIVAHMQKTALTRANSNYRPPFYFYLDEFQNYTTDNIEDILSESRKYALSLTLAHQFLDQLPNKLQSAVLNTSGTIASFRVGYHDARRLAKDIFPSSDFLYDFKFKPSYRIPRFDEMGWDGLAQELSNLPQRHFWTRRRGQYNPVKQHSFNMPNPKYTPELKRKIKALRDYSGQKFGKSKVSVLKKTKKSTYNLTNIPIWTE